MGISNKREALQPKKKWNLNMEKRENQEAKQMVEGVGQIAKEKSSTTIWMILWCLEVMILMNPIRKEKRKAKGIQEVIKKIHGIQKLHPTKITVERSQSKKQRLLGTKTRVTDQNQSQNPESIRMIP